MAEFTGNLALVSGILYLAANLRVRKVGGIYFARLFRVRFSFCVARVITERSN